MYAELQAGLTSLKTALSLAQAGKGVIDQAALASALYEVQSRLLETQSAALQSMEENAILTKRVRELEAAATELEDWKQELARYELTRVADGILAYTEVGRSDRLRDAVKLCADCFGKREKSILQMQHADMRQLSLNCNRCKSRLVFRSFSDVERAI
jgi:hypothetical protein